MAETVVKRFGTLQPMTLVITLDCPPALISSHGQKQAQTRTKAGQKHKLHTNKRGLIKNLNTTPQQESPMDAITVIGLIAALFTTVSLLPQLIKVYKTKSTKDISTGMFALFGGGVLLWFIYGLLVNDFPIIIANSLAFVQAVIILVFKLKFK